MAADVTIYCLGRITDYSAFERLCHDLMALDGYRSIEPLGNFKDKGRDAIHIDASGGTTIFAYSVREDWRAKLAEDAAKIHRHKHTCDRLVFITTSEFTAGERDEAIASIKEEYGWPLQLYGVERLRVMLDVNHTQVKEAHPQIFPPALLRLQSSADATTRDHLFISYDPRDVAFAEWLTQKLTAEGYRVWCERFKLLGGENYPQDVDAAIKNQTCRMLGVYSQASLKNPEVMRQRTLALSIAGERAPDFLIPLNFDGVDRNHLDRVTGSLNFVPFVNDWAGGLRLLLEKLKTVNCPKLLPDGRSVAASAFADKDILTGRMETLYSNCFRIERMPEVVHRLKTRRDVPEGRLETLQHEWAYRMLDSRRFLSFHHPPGQFAGEYQASIAGGESWSDVEKIDGIKSHDLVVELLRKSFVVKCHERGLRFCPETSLHYFPAGLLKSDRLYFSRPDGSRTFVSSAGQRKYWKPAGSEEYRYSLAPVFAVSEHLFDGFVMMTRIRIRLTDTDNAVLPGRKRNSRRKHLCENWWNDDWFNRSLAVVQHIAEEGKIVIGALPKEQIIVSAMPISVSASEGIDEKALDQLSYERSELLAVMKDEDVNEDIEEGATGDG